MSQDQFTLDFLTFSESNLVSQAFPNAFWRKKKKKKSWFNWKEMETWFEMLSKTNNKQVFLGDKNKPDSASRSNILLYMLLKLIFFLY